MTGYYLQKNWRFVLLAGGIGIALFLVILIVDSGWISKAMTDKGTNIGYQRCLEQNKGQGLEDAAVKRLCLRKHGQLIYPKFQARGGYNFTGFYHTEALKIETRDPALAEKVRRLGSEEFSFSGWIENKSDDIIITSFAVEVKHEDNKDSSRQPIIERLQIEDVWIQPGQKGDFRKFDLQFKPKEDRLQIGDRFLYTWSIIDIKGIRIKLK